MSDYPQAITPVDHVERVPRRVRAEFGGQVVLDTTRAIYLWEWPFYPQYLDPRTMTSTRPPSSMTVRPITCGSALS